MKEAMMPNLDADDVRTGVAILGAVTVSSLPTVDELAKIGQLLLVFLSILYAGHKLFRSIKKQKMLDAEWLRNSKSRRAPKHEPTPNED